MNKFISILVVLVPLWLTGCFTVPSSLVQDIVNIEAAENLHYTDNDRLFATGGKGFFEILSNGVSHQAIQKKNNCDATGIAELQGWLFFPCAAFINGVNTLWAYNLLTEEVAKVGDLPDYQLANGMDSLGNDTLFISNTDFIFQAGSIAKLTIDFSANTPQILDQNINWASSNEGVTNPNGLSILGNRLYFTENNTLRYALIDGSDLLSIVTELDAPGDPIFDDIEVTVGNYVLVTSFLEGVIYQVNGNCFAKTERLFDSASSIRLGRGPFQGKLLVTQRLGNRISVIDLAIIDALPCP